MALARLILTLQPQSYTGADLEELYPSDFHSKYTTTVGFKWRQSDMGPESWSLTIAAGYALGKLASGFAGELSKDLYKWTKDSIFKVIKKRKGNYGAIYIDCKDVWIEFITFYPNDNLLDFFEQLPDLLSKIDPSLCEDWSITYVEGHFRIKPNQGSIRERLTTNTARDVDDNEVMASLNRWEESQKDKENKSEEPTPRSPPD